MDIKTELVKVAKKIAKELVSVDFQTQDAYDKYMHEHPDADKTNHRVVKNVKAPDQQGSQGDPLHTRQRGLWDDVGSIVEKEQKRSPSQNPQRLKLKAIQDVFGKNYAGKNINWENVWKGLDSWKKDPKTIRQGITSHELRNKISDFVEQNLK